MYGSISPSDKSKKPLTFKTKEEAQRHCDIMDKCLETYDDEKSIWNKEYWATKPEPWIIVEIKG